MTSNIASQVLALAMVHSPYSAGMASNVNSNLSRKNASLDCVVRLDRVIFGANPTFSVPTPEIAETTQFPSPLDMPGYKVVKDTWGRPQGPKPTYRRVRSLRSLENGAFASIQYEPLMPWLMPFRVTLIGDDWEGIMPDELMRFATKFSRYKLSLVELAFDFDLSSGVDEKFVLRHAVFGKSWRSIKYGKPGWVRYGARKSLKLVRCYLKSPLDCFRVELEVHASLLRKYKVRNSGDFERLHKNLFPAHILFVGIRWKALKKYLIKRFGSEGEAFLEEALRRADESLRKATRFLARKGVLNVRRFLRPLRINDQIEMALKRWAKAFATKTP